MNAASEEYCEEMFSALHSALAQKKQLRPIAKPVIFVTAKTIEDEWQISFPEPFDTAVPPVVMFVERTVAPKNTPNEQTESVRVKQRSYRAGNTLMDVPETKTARLLTITAVRYTIRPGHPTKRDPYLSAIVANDDAAPENHGVITPLRQATGGIQPPSGKHLKHDF